MSKFNHKFYISAYPDLGIQSPEEALVHYVVYGKQEGRLPDWPEVNPKFNWKVYLTLNKDLAKKGLNKKSQAYDHYYRYGCNENRVICLEDYHDITRGKYLLKANQHSLIDDT